MKGHKNEMYVVIMFFMFIEENSPEIEVQFV